MKEITEEDLHLYFVNKRLLSQDKVNAIETLESSDTGFRGELKEIEEYYSEYNKISTRKSVEYILMEYESGSENISKDDDQVKLAAMQSGTELSQQKYFKTFLSSDNYLVTRVFYNPSFQEYDLYIISESNKIDAAYAVLYLAEIGKEFVANSKGIIKIKSRFIDFPGQISIRLPIAKLIIGINDNGALIRNDFSFKNDENEFTLGLELTGNVLNGVVKDMKNDASIKYNIFLVQTLDEEIIIPLDINDNKFTLQLPAVKDFIISVVAGKQNF